MIILTVVVCLFAERFLGSLHVLRSFTWLETYSHFILKQFTSPLARKGKIPVLLIVLPPAIIVQLVDNQLAQLFFPLELLFGIGILLYSLGPQPFYDRYKELCDLKSQDTHVCSHQYAEQVLNRPLSSSEKNALPQVIAQSLFAVSNDRLFAPIFWFVLAGPLGAVLFRCTSQLYFAAQKTESAQNQYHNIAAATSTLYAILNWAPSRLSAFGFAAMGDFRAAIRNYPPIKNVLFHIDQKGNDLLLSSVGSAAINLSDNAGKTTVDKIPEALAILRRNTQLWMGAIAALTLAGWIS